MNVSQVMPSAASNPVGYLAWVTPRVGPVAIPDAPLHHSLTHARKAGGYLALGVSQAANKRRKLAHAKR